MANNLDTPTTPNTRNYRKVTTDAYFTPDTADGKTGDIRLGNITMSSLKHGNTETEIMRAVKGSLQRAAVDTTEVKPEYDLTLNEYTPNLVAVLLFGTIGADQVQASATAATVTFASVNIGRTYRIGKTAISNVAVAVGGTAKTADIDFQLDADKGVITIMDGGSITDAAAVTVTYDCAAVTRKTVLPYTRLSNLGYLRLFEEDSQSRVRSEIFFRCQLTPTEFGDGDPKKYSESKIKCAVLGAITRYER